MFKKIATNLKKYKNIVSTRFAKRDGVDNFILSGLIWIYIVKLTPLAMDKFYNFMMRFSDRK